jgi:RHS repeat-associated protein
LRLHNFDKRGFRTAKYINGQLVQRYQWKDLTTLTAVEDAEGISKFHYNEHGRSMGMSRNGQVFLFATDQLGSIFTVADSSGNSVQDILYDSFGRRVYNSDPEYDPGLGFGGGLYDSDTGLIHFGYREYDPVIGRFISPDPLGYEGGDVDVYAYCQDEPVNGTDPFGLFRFGKRTLGALKSLDTKTAIQINEAAKNTTQGRIISAISDAVGDDVEEVMDKENVELKHEHGFYEDGSGDNVGFFKKGKSDQEKPEGYEFEEKHYDDKRMERAEKSVEEGEYSLLGNPITGKKKNNCQDYADKLRKRYEELERGDRMR